MNRKRKLISYFEKTVEIDLQAIEEIEMQPREQISLMGGVRSWYLACCTARFDQVRKGIEYAGYKYPDSDSVWDRAINVCKLITAEKLSMYGY